MSEDDADDWMFQSIKLYNDLHMYELQHPTQSIEFISQNSLALACQLPDGTSEILQLALPSALSQSGKNDLLSKASDFKVLSGGLYSRTITSLRQVPNSRILLAGEKEENCVTLWNLPDTTDESGLITSTGLLRHSSSSSNVAAVIDATETRLTYGSHMSDIAVVDISTRQTVFSAADFKTPAVSDIDPRISELKFLNEVTLLSCERYTGSISIIDTRSKSDVQLNTSQASAARWACDVSQSPAADGHGRIHVRKLCSDGHVYLCDIRWLDSDIETIRLDQMWTSKSRANDTEYMTIKCRTGDIFSVSGVSDGDVCIYKNGTSSVGGRDEHGTTLSPIFTHIGHRVSPIHRSDDAGDVMVWSHCWHPGLEDALLSCASDGSLHAWQLKKNLLS